MGKYVFITDLHLHNFTEFAKPDKDFITDRFKAQLDTLQKAFDIAKEEEAMLLIGGDVFHNRGSINTRVFNRTFEVFANNPEVKTVIVRGNHDSVTNSLHTSSSIEPLGVLPHVEVISEPTRENFDGDVFLFMPYGDEIDEMKEEINSFTPHSEHKSIFVGHIGVDGASQGKGSHRLSGAFGLGDLRPDVFDYILLGHYHKRQQLGGNPHYVYGGNMMQVNFGDEGQEKGVHLLDTEADTLDFIPIKNKMFVTINGNNIPDNLNELIADNYVRFQGTREQVKAIARVEEAQGELGTLRVELEKDYRQEARMGLDATMSPIEITKTFAEQKYPNAVEAALECLNKVI